MFQGKTKIKIKNFKMGNFKKKTEKKKHTFYGLWWREGKYTKKKKKIGLCCSLKKNEKA